MPRYGTYSVLSSSTTNYDLFVSDFYTVLLEPSSYSATEITGTYRVQRLRDGAAAAGLEFTSHDTDVFNWIVGVGDRSAPVEGSLPANYPTIHRFCEPEVVPTGRTVQRWASRARGPIQYVVTKVSTPFTNPRVSWGVMS